VLSDVLDTPISPELVPGKSEVEPGRARKRWWPVRAAGFHPYYILRFGYLPTKVAFIAWCTARPASSNWPDIPEGHRNQYAIGDIKKWLAVFVRRFFQFAQYKRSAIPNAPKVAPAVARRAATPRAQRQRGDGVAGGRRAHSRPRAVRNAARPS
jgi:NAD+ synthase (glutamine-hydrolysing)